MLMNQTDIGAPLNQTMCKAMKKDRTLQELNYADDLAPEKRRLRKQVIDILSDVLDHRQA